MQLKALANQLMTIGLNEKEARVYVAALFLGPAAVQRIAEQAGVNRATTYVILEKLAKMGFVSQAGKRKKAKFVAEDPVVLDRWLASQEERLRAQRADLKALLPALRASQRGETEAAPVVRFYKGLEGIRTINADNLRKARPGSTLYAIMDADEVDKILPENFFRSPRARLRKKIRSKLFYWSAKRTIETNAKLLRETRRLSAPPKADLNLYEDRVTLATYKGEHSIGVVIESKEIAQLLRQLFEIAWGKGQ